MARITRLGGGGAPRSLAAAVFLAVLGVLCLGVSPSQAAPERLSPPAGVTASPGTTGTIATIGWTPTPGASGYRVWRSMRSLRGFEAVGSTDGTWFADASGIPGRTYYYRVTSMLPDGHESRPSTPTDGVEADWNSSPHATYGKGNLCLTCHALHKDDGRTDVAGGEVAICHSCHDGQGARSNVKDGARDSFALASGHRVEEATRGADSTNSCSSCHSPHADPRKRSGLFRVKVAGKGVNGGNEWCDACHDDASSWSPDYPALSDPDRDPSGYPVLGTYPGPAVYRASATSGHAGIAGRGAKGDCLLCHAAHRGPNAYDGLLETYRAPTASTLASDLAEASYATLCLTCHDGSPEWRAKGAADIASFVRRSSGGAGHSIVTSGGTLPVGAPVPCYDCHNPHGSSRGNESLLSDELGAGLSTKHDESVRAFCLSCHATSDGLRWDSEESTYSPAGTRTVEGLRRDGSDGSLLRLRDGSSEAHASVAEASCYDCHGRDGSTPGGAAHDPKRARGASPIAPSVRGGERSGERTPTPSAAVRQVRRPSRRSGSL